MATTHLAPNDQSQSAAGDPNHGRITFHDGPVERVREPHRSILAPASHFLHEWRTYTVRCSGAMRLELGSQSSTAIVEGLFQVQFENQIGLAQIRAFDSAGNTLDTRHVEVISAKLGGPNESLAFLKAILADLTSERGAMAFMPRATTSRTVQQVQRPPSLLVQYFFLLNYAEEIEEALHHVLRSPHGVLDDEMEHVSIFDVTEVDADVVLQLVQGGAQFDQSVSSARLKAAPGGVWFRVPREGHDSAENQFVKAVATAMADACEDVLGAPWLQNLDDPGVVHRHETLSRLGSQLRRFVRSPMFDEVGPMQRVPSSSRVLQRRPGYRDLNAHWHAFLQARDPVWQRMQRAIDLRDIATLYEYWVWFALCREIQDAYASARPEVSTIAPSELGLPHGLKARFRGHGTLTYNATRRAYSGITLRPDYLWEPEVGAKVGFDAKFRLAWDAPPLNVGDADTSGDPLAKAKADDLVKMHAYRDAIPGLRCAVVLFPGSVAEFRTTEKETIVDITVGDVVIGELNGVGAIPMSPVGVNNG